MHDGGMGEMGMMGGMSGHRDPVCGRAIDPDTAPKATHKGKTYYFGGRQGALREGPGELSEEDAAVRRVPGPGGPTSPGLGTRADTAGNLQGGRSDDAYATRATAGRRGRRGLAAGGRIACYTGSSCFGLA